jgi:DegV family protein with EDD domain
MTLRVVTDSTCDLPQSLVDEYGITIVPAYINFGEQSYQDGVDISRTEFYEKLPESDPLPTTAAPSIDAFKKVYAQLAAEGATEILSIHISHTLSNFINSAKKAAEEFTTIPVTVHDSGQLSLALGLLALKAAKAAQEGCDMDEIIKILEDAGKRTFAFAKLDTLDYLRRGGRLSHLQHSIVSMLDIKPILKMNQGVSKMEMVRTRKKSFKRLKQLAKEFGTPEVIGITHANAPDQVQELIEEINGFCPEQVPLINITTPVLGTHVGPGTVCIVCIKEDLTNPEPKGYLAQITRRAQQFGETFRNLPVPRSEGYQVPPETEPCLVSRIDEQFSNITKKARDESKKYSESARNLADKAIDKIKGKKENEE